MKRQKVNSSNIAAIAYSKRSKVLEVEFKSGSVYQYQDVPEKVWEGFNKAESKGKYFTRNIKISYKFKKGEFKEVRVPNIYICGKAGSGKTYAAKYLIEKCGYQQAKFAFPVYGLAVDYFDMKKKDRKLLQTIGTDSGRDKINTDIWVNRFVEDTKIVQLTRQALDMPEVGFVCDDCRFPNEHEILDKNGWVGIFLDVSDEVREQRLSSRDGDAQTATLNHASETSVDIFKDQLIKIDSSGTLENTYRQLDELLERLSVEE